MNELLTEGLQLMGVGMGVVFLFLGLLVGVINMVSRVIQGFETKQKATLPAAESDEDLIKVAAEAVKRYRADHC